MSTVCDRFGKRAWQQGGENELNKVDREEESRLTVVHKKKGAKCHKNRVRGREEQERRGQATGRERERERERGGPLCGSLTDNGLIRPNVA